MIAYRFQTKDGQWQWLQTSSRLIYKNSKPDFVISTHRPLMEEEGRDLLGKRTMDFKVSYLDAGLTNSYFTEQDQLIATNTPTTSNHSNSTTPPRVNRRYKTQLRDFLSTCRTKRKLSTASSNGQLTPTNNITSSSIPTAPIPNPMPTVDYLPADAAAAYNMYTGSYATPTPADHGLTYSANFQHSLYPSAATTALDNRYLATTDNIFHQYRPLTTYYPEYHHTSATPGYNGFLDMQSRATTCASIPTYDATPPSSHHSPYQITGRTAVMPVDEKLYSTCQQSIVDPTSNKYATYVDSSRGYVVANNKCLDVSWPYSVSPSSGIIQPVQVSSQFS